MSIGDNIKKIRKSKGLKQSELAKLSNVSRVAIGNYERGDRTPNIDIIGRISSALKVSVSELIGDFNFENEHDNLKKYIYSDNGYIPVKKLDLLSDIAFIASNQPNPSEPYTELLDWLTDDEKYEIIDFIITSFKVKFSEIYAGNRKDDIDHDINLIKKQIEDGLIFLPGDEN